VIGNTVGVMRIATGEEDARHPHWRRPPLPVDLPV